MMKESKLQPLRIVSGWYVEWNLFYEIDPLKENMTYLDSSSLFHLSNSLAKVTVNLEWRPGHDVNGNYILRVIQLSEVENRKGKISYEGD